MAADTPNNRGHRGFHRGGRGPDRRGGRGQERGGDRNAERNVGSNADRGQARGQDRGQDNRPQACGPAPIRTENADVAQIMRDIRARIAQRQGISLTDQQIEELAARRLEAILDVRAVSLDLLDQLRRAAGGRSVDVPTGAQSAGYEFEDDTLYETPRGLLRTMRRLLNPVLKLLFNPEPLVMALHQQAKLNAAAASREAERVAQQAEWNGLHYALLQRLVSELAKLSLEAQHLAMQVESLSAKVDFSDRRVRSIEGGVHQAEVRSAPQQPPAPRVEGGFTATAQDGGGSTDRGPGGGSSLGDGSRRRRRRRRGRRPGGPDQPMGGSAAAPGAPAEDGPDNDGADDAFADGGNDSGDAGPDTFEGRSGDTGDSQSGDSGSDGGSAGDVMAVEPPVAAPAQVSYGFSSVPVEPVGTPAASEPAASEPAAPPEVRPDAEAPRDPVEP